MTKPSRQLHWDSYCESEPVSICASAVSVCLYPPSTFPVTRATCSHTPSCLCPPLVLEFGFFFPSVSWIAVVCVLFICLLSLRLLRWVFVGMFSGADRECCVKTTTLQRTKQCDQCHQNHRPNFINDANDQILSLGSSSVSFASTLFAALPILPCFSTLLRPLP